MVAVLGDSGCLEIEIVGMNLSDMLGIKVGESGRFAGKIELDLKSQISNLKFEMGATRIPLVLGASKAGLYI